MDPLSITASVVALAGVVRESVRLVQGIKDGGNDRLRVATEIKGLLIVLRSVEGFCETLDEDARAPWIEALRTISEEGGILESARVELQKLNETLEPKTGRQKLIQSVRWPILDKVNVNRTLQHVIRLRESMTSILEQANTSMTQSIMSDTKELYDALQNDNIQAVSDWISPLNMLAKQASLTESCGEGSGRWLLDLSVFQIWKEAKKEILWCPGIPGAGKTFMSSIVVQHLRESFKQQNIGVFMFYISFNDPGTQSIDHILEALLKQIILSTKRLDPGLLDLYHKLAPSQTRPSRAELASQIDIAVAGYAKSYLVLDALDELLEDNARLELLETLWGLDGDVNLFITSRMLPTIQQHFRSSSNMCDICNERSLKSFYHCLDCMDWDACILCFSSSEALCDPAHKHMKQFHAYFIEISAKSEDLDSYIRSRIKKNSSLKSIIAKKPGLEQDIVTTITRLAKDRFLIAKFHMDTLANLHRPSQVVQALKDLPSRIDETYDQAMQRINAAEQNREEAKEVLRWVIHAYRPLHIREIEHATAIYPDQEDLDPDDIISADLLCSWCAGLVVIEAGILRLVHYTAKDYFMTSGDRWFSDGSKSLGQACLTYLSLNAFSSMSVDGEKAEAWEEEVGQAAIFFEKALHYPLLDYASMNWPMHILKSEDEDLINTACEFLSKDVNVKNLTMAYRSTSCSSSHTHEHRYNGLDLFDGASALHIASFWGLEQIVTILLDDGSDINVTDAAGLTPLMYASIQGSHGVVDILLKAGSQVNIQCYINSTALHRAIFHGHEEVVKSLLRSKELDMSSREGKTGFTPLSSAIFQRKDRIVAHLLAVTESSSREDCPALIWAAYHGDANIVKLLLHHMKDQVNLQDNLGRTALVSAARKDNNSDVIQVLLEAGADPNIVDECANTPLMEAVNNGFPTNVRQFLKAGVTSTWHDKARGGLIISATQAASHPVLCVVLEELDVFDINAQDSCNRTALHYAAKNDLPLIALTLLEFGASTDVRDKYGYSPIQLASQQFNITTHRILLEAAQHVASELEESFSRVEMHVLKASPSTHDQSFTETERLVGTESEQIIGDVLHNSVYCKLEFDPHREHEDFFQTRSALQYSIENGEPIIAQTILEAGVDLNNYEENGDGPRHRQPLEIKRARGSIKVTELLAKHIRRKERDDIATKTVDDDQIKNALAEHGNGFCKTADVSPATRVNEFEWGVALFLVTFLSKDI